MNRLCPTLYCNVKFAHNVGTLCEYVDLNFNFVHTLKHKSKSFMVYTGSRHEKFCRISSDECQVVVVDYFRMIFDSSS